MGEISKGVGEEIASSPLYVLWAEKTRIVCTLIPTHVYTVHYYASGWLGQKRGSKA